MTDKTDYPEHLNPFKKRNGIRGSFRDLKSALKRTFSKNTGKIEVPLRVHKDTSAYHDSATIQTRQSTTATLRHSTPSGGSNEALPRFRFNERVNKAKTFAPSIPTIVSENPFDEEKDDPNSVENQTNVKENLTVNQDPGKLNPGTMTRRHKRKKKRAPLPPNHLASLNVHDHHESKWSINSYETDCSSYTYGSDNEQEIVNENDNKNILDISNEIQNFCNEANNDLKSNEVITKTTMPDIVVSVENDGKLVIEETDCNIKTDPIIEEDGTNAINCDLKNVQLNENDKNDLEYQHNTNENASDLENVKAYEIKAREVTQIDDDIKKNNEEENVKVNQVINEISKTELENSTNEDLIDDQNNNKMTLNEVEESSNEINFVESTTIFISGSQDNLDNEFKENKSIYISGSCDSLDVSSDTNCKQHDSNNENAPIPKVRKHKLPKATLLGITTSDY